MTGAEAVALDAEATRADLEERFQALVGTHRERAVRLAWRLVGGDDAAAEDVAQEAFVRAYRALPRFREEAIKRCRALEGRADDPRIHDHGFLFRSSWLRWYQHDGDEKLPSATACTVSGTTSS